MQSSADFPTRSKRIVVVGAGPGGAIAAALLAQKGCTVKVIEKRARPQDSDPPIRRGVMFALKKKSVEIIEKIGIHVPPEGYVDGMHNFRGVNSRSWDGGMRTLRLNDSSILVERHVIAYNIIKAIEKWKLPNLTVCFEASCTGIDVESRIVRYTSRDGVEHEEPYDLLIGADGVHSLVRKSLDEFDPTFKVRQMQSRSRYKTIRALPRPKDADDLMEIVGPGYFCTLFVKPCKIGGKAVNQLVFSVYETEDGLMHLNLSGAMEDVQALEGNEREWIENHAPSLLPKSWHEELVRQISAAPLSKIGPVTHCSSMIGPSMAIIGDAAHSTTPIYGVGANMAIQDGDALADALDECNWDIAKGLEMFEQARLEEVQSIIRFEEVTKFSRIENPERLWTAFKSFHDAFHTKGNKYFPRMIHKPVIMRVLFGEITYPQALKIFKREARVVSSLGIAVAGIISSVAWACARGKFARK